MAQLHTNEGIEGEINNCPNTLDEWLGCHKLIKAKSKFLEWGITLEELTELSAEYDDEQLKLLLHTHSNVSYIYIYTVDSQQIFRSYALTTLQLDILETKRFIKGVNTLKPTVHEINTCPQISISNEEDEALNKIMGMRADIKSKISKSEIDINKLKQAAKTNNDQLNQTRDDILQQVNQKIDELIIQSDQIMNNKMQKISSYIHELQELEKLLGNNATIQKIPSATYTLQDLEIVSVEINVNGMQEFIENIAEIHDDENVI